MKVADLDERFCRSFEDGVRRGGLWIAPGEVCRIRPLVSSGAWPTDLSVAQVVILMLLIDHVSLRSIIRAKKEEIKELRRDVGNVDKQARLRVEVENRSLVRSKQELEAKLREMESRCAELDARILENASEPMTDRERDAWQGRVDALNDRVKQLALHVELLKKTNHQLSEKLRLGVVSNG